jgi:hypothetical protein
MDPYTQPSKAAPDSQPQAFQRFRDEVRELIRFAASRLRRDGNPAF